jgi:uncharacterized membrane protein
MANKPPAPSSPHTHSDKLDATLVSAQWSGPLPPPAVLQQFNQIIPNGAERILALVEQEQAHRFALDNAMLKQETKDTQRRHYLGWSIGLTAIAASLGSVYLGAHWSVSIALVSLPIAAIIRSIMQRD